MLFQILKQLTDFHGTRNGRYDAGIFPVSLLLSFSYLQLNDECGNVKGVRDTSFIFVYVLICCR
jgi:hypothetical protein